MNHKIYNFGSGIYTFSPAPEGQPLYSGAIEHNSLKCTGLLPNRGIGSDRLNLPTKKESLYTWRAKTKLINSGIIGSNVLFYYQNREDLDGNLGLAANIYGSDKLKNLNYIGCLDVDSSVSGEVLSGGGLIKIRGSGIQIFCYNNTNMALTNEPQDHIFRLLENSYEIQ